ncbi:MAG: hypothetical protein N3A68_03170 [Bacteroidia bacterium]|nr:hypothetical protein [Bacteroidia bacterium]GIV22869.1 MAG: hypothetical protein KatS3mg025_0528 [Bacteroidia bacterium]
MRVGAFFVLVGGAALSFFFPAGTPLFEARYVLTASRWAVGEVLYHTLSAPIDPAFAAAYRFFPTGASYLLQAWKALGLVALGLFFLLTLPKEAPLRTSIGVGLWLMVYALRQWDSPLEAGEPALWLLLLLFRAPIRVFEQGILWAAASILFPAAVWALPWFLYRLVEERRLGHLFPFLLGVGWTCLGGVALLTQLSLLSAYIHAYWLSVWPLSMPGWSWAYLSSVLALLIFLTESETYARRAYSERRLFRDTLWAAVTSMGLPALQGGAVWPAILTLPMHSYLKRALVALLVVFQGGQGLWQYFHRPTCTLALPPHSCFWGVPPCYLHLLGPYGCNLIPPEIGRGPYAWEDFYKAWGNPTFIYDASSAWAEVCYYLPYRCTRYAPVDTLLLGKIRLYQRR